MKEYFRKPYMTQGIAKHSDYMKAIPQRAIDVQGTIAPNIEFKKPYDYHPNSPQMIHYYANNLHYMGGDPVPPLNDPSLLPHAPVVETPITESGTIVIYPMANSDDCRWSPSRFSEDITPAFSLGWGDDGALGSAYIRFPNVKIPRSSIIDSAILTLYSSISVGGAGTEVKTIIYGNDADTSIAPTSTAQGNALVLTSASAAWEGTENWAAVGSSHNSPEIKNVVSEIVSRSGWARGNAIGIIIAPNGGATPRYAYCFNDGNAVYYPQLTIRFH